MQFKYPELLYALFLLIIPIIVHLFQLRRFQKVEFTNVQFLKNVVLQTRKSSQLKKWLTLLTRLLLFTVIIMAFAQPFYSKSNALNTEVETVIYLDNSFSMQAKGDKGELLKRAVQDLISTIDNQEAITLFTNDDTYRNTTISAIKNDLLQLDYSSNQLEYNAVMLKGNQLFSKNNANIKNFILISDFQEKYTTLNLDDNTSHNTFVVKLSPVNTNNISIDSVFVSKTDATQIELSVALGVNGNQDISNVPISLFQNDNLIAKTSISSTNNLASFSLPNNTKINGMIGIEDDYLQFDNTLYFNINELEKINVLSVNGISEEEDFLSRVYTEDEFNYNSVSLDQLNYNDINQQNLIILNAIENIPIALSNTLNQFMNDGGFILIIPSINADLNSYNQLLNQNRIINSNASEKRITTINYSHPVFNNVFDKQVTNFQYPKVNRFYDISFNRGALLQYEDGQPFLIQEDQVFLFTASLDDDNSNFKNSPLIVPTLYNIGRQSLKLSNLYYTIGQENNFDVNAIMQQDDILKFKTNTLEIIPQQQTFNNKVSITTHEAPSLASTYEIINNSSTIEHVSYNYDRKESILSYSDLSNVSTIQYGDSVPELFNDLKSDLNINALWKWFVIFALALLIIEMLILNYFK